MPDRTTSRVLLAGTARYSDPNVNDIPGVANNLRALHEAFTAPGTGAFDTERTLVIEDLDSRGLVRFAEHATDSDDTLLFYYAGHAFLDEVGELYLGHADTRADLPRYTALPFDSVSHIVRSSPARNRIIILDCCFSGRALGTEMSARDHSAIGSVDVEGSWVLTAASAQGFATAPTEQQFTAFTGALLSVLRDGVDNGEEYLRVGDIYPEVRTRLAADGAPLPQQRITDRIAGLALARNARTAT